MNIDFLKKLMLFLVFCLVQVLVLGHIHLLGVATPLLYVYFILLMPRNYPKWGILLWAFCMGVIIDTFSNTAGVASASLTLIGALQPYVLEAFVPRDSADDLVPSHKSLGAGAFMYYSFLITLIYCLLFFTLEMFSFFNLLFWTECVAGSLVITLLLILVVENVRKV